MVGYSSIPVLELACATGQRGVAGRRTGGAPGRGRGGARGIRDGRHLAPERGLSGEPVGIDELR